MAGFAHATAVDPVGAGVYSADLDSGWTVGEGLNGGYLMALMGRAAVAGGPGHAHPLAMTAHFGGSAVPGRAEVAVEVLRAGRFASQMRATLRQDDRSLVHALLTLGHLGDEDPRWSGAPPAALPPVEGCEPIPSSRSKRWPMRLWETLELRMDPATLSWAFRQPNGDPESRGWLLPESDEPFDPLMLLVALDCLPAVTFQLGSRGWVPTLELTAYLRALPAPGPLRLRQRAQLVQHGLVDELCQVWDARGRLVAQGSQLAGVRFPETES